MKRLTTDQSGVALIMVLASLVILTTVVVEFAFQSHVTYEIAAGQRDRLKAAYLARSAMNLVSLELKAERQLRQQFAPLLQNLGGDNMLSGPFCKTFPLSTGLLQGLFTGSVPEAGNEGKKEGKEEKKDESGEGPFQLGGEFEGSCDSEEGKINLNVFRPANPTAAESVRIYEGQKTLLLSLLRQKSFEPIFEGKGADQLQKVVNHLADWADPDDQVNESPGITGGSEDADYSSLPYKPKNGKYGTVAEALLIPSMEEGLYRLLEPNLTVYGEGRLNLCFVHDDLIRAFIAFVAESSPTVAPLSREDERPPVILESIRTICERVNPSVGEIAQTIVSGLGGGDVAEITKRIAVNSRFYTIHAVGESGEVRMKIRAVVDTGGGQALGKILYYRIESG